MVHTILSAYVKRYERDNMFINGLHNRPLVLNDIHTCRKLVVREGTRIDVSVK